MTRQEALNTIRKRLFAVLGVALAIGIGLIYIAGDGVRVQQKSVSGWYKFSYNKNISDSYKESL